MRLNGLWPAWLLCQLNSPGRNIGVGSQLFNYIKKLKDQKKLKNYICYSLSLNFKILVKH